MNFLTKAVYWLSLIVILALAVLSFIFIGWQAGSAITVGLVAFIIAYILSDKVAVSRRDRYTRSEWSVFCKKLCWAWGVGLVAYGLSYLIIAYNFGDPIGVLPS